jgi:hypothetical protein
MSTTTASPRTCCVQWLIESRPPSLTWSRSSPPQRNQPPLNLAEPDHAEAAAPDERGVRASLVKARWAAQQRPGLPDAREWSATLALAVIQTLLGQRPVAQLNRSKHALAGTCNLCRRGPRLARAAEDLEVSGMLLRHLPAAEADARLRLPERTRTPTVTRGFASLAHLWRLS